MQLKLKGHRFLKQLGFASAVTPLDPSVIDAQSQAWSGEGGHVCVWATATGTKEVLSEGNGHGAASRLKKKMKRRRKWQIPDWKVMWGHMARQKYSIQQEGSAREASGVQRQMGDRSVCTESVEGDVTRPAASPVIPKAAWCASSWIYTQRWDIILLWDCAMLGALWLNYKTSTPSSQSLHHLYFQFWLVLPQVSTPFPGLVSNLYMVTQSFSCTMHAHGLGLHLGRGLLICGCEF